MMFQLPAALRSGGIEKAFREKEAQRLAPRGPDRSQQLMLIGAALRDLGTLGPRTNLQQTAASVGEQVGEANRRRAAMRAAQGMTVQEQELASAFPERFFLGREAEQERGFRSGEAALDRGFRADEAEKARAYGDEQGEKERGFRAELERERSAQRERAAAEPRYGLTPIYGTDADGRRVAFQMGSNGTLTQLPTPDGVTLENDFFRSRQRELGKGRAKVELGRTKAGATLETAALNKDRLIEDLNKAIEQSGRGNTGVIGGRLTMTSGQQDFASLVDSIKARIGFEELQTMRDNSPTGGALGQVTEREIAFLQALRGSIDRLQSEGALDANLGRIVQDVEASFQRMQDAYLQDYDAGLFNADGVNQDLPGVVFPKGAPDGAPSDQPAPEGVDPVDWQYMSPEERALWRDN